MGMSFGYGPAADKQQAMGTRGQAHREAAQQADAVLLAVHWSRIDDVLNQAGDLPGKVMVSCSLPLNAQNTELVLGHTISGAEELAKKVSGAEVIAAFNNVPSEVLFGVFEARGNATPPSMVYCGDKQTGKNIGLFPLIRERLPEPRFHELICGARFG